MNASRVFNQLVKQVGGQQGSGGADLKAMLNGLSRQIGGGQKSEGKGVSGSGSGGLDVSSLLGGGALGMLVGNRRGRKLGGKAFKYSALAGVGMLAWKAWQNYQGSKGSNPAEAKTVDSLSGKASEQRSLELLQALIMAARADGHIDEREQAMLTEQMDALGADPELHSWVEQQLRAPLDAEALARQADSPQAAREMYLISLAVIDEQNPMERAWLDQLAQALKLEPELARELERQAQTAE